MATIGVQSSVWVALAVATIVLVGGIGFGIWSLRPIPAYASGGIELSSPLSADFQIENTSPWFAMSRVKLTCSLMQAGTPNMPTVEASGLRASDGNASTLLPSTTATFKCPFHAVPGGSGDQELHDALRSEIYFHAEYELPIFGSFRITEERGPYSLNTRLLPPRWTAKANP